MNIKKLFALLAGVSMVAQTVVPAGALAATYSEELQGAYDWAHENGITTMATIDNANMYGNITRAEMAKMLANYAKNLMGKTADETAACSFTDTASVQGDLATAIVEACQLGIMGQGISAFRPYDTISRAEFGTALSRLLWGDTYEGGKPYYAKHLDALKAAGIMTQISNAEKTKEVRGYVMLMLQRASGLEGESEECDAMTKLICNADPENALCPEACRPSEEENNDPDEEVVVKSGDLVVTTENSNGQIFIGRPSDLDYLTFKTSEEVTISKVVLEREGYSTKADVVSVRLEDDNGAKMTEPKGIDSKGQVKLTLKKDYKTVDGSLNATIVVETSGGMAPGATMGFKVIDVESTAEELSLPSKFGTYSAIKYDGSSLTISHKASTQKDYNFVAGDMYEVAKFKVNTPDDSSIVLRGFTFKNADDLDLRKYFEDAEVYVAGEEVKGLEASVNKNDELVVSFKDTEVAAKTKAEVIVKISLVEDFDEFKDVVNLTLTDIVAVDGKVSSRVSITTDASNKKLPLALQQAHAFLGSKIRLSNVKLGNIDAAQNSEDVVIAEGSITVSEALKGDVVIVAKGDGTGAIKDLTFVVNGEEYDSDSHTTNASGYAVYSFNGVEIEKSGKIKVLLDTQDVNTYDNDVITFDLINYSSFSNLKYDESGKSVNSGEFAGSITVQKVTIKPATASLTNTVTKDVEFKTQGNDTKPVFEGTYTAKKGDIKLNEFELTATATAASTGSKVTFYVYVDDMDNYVADAVVSCDASACTGTNTFDNVLVEAGKSVTVKVEAEVEAEADATTGTMGKFDFVIRGEDVNGNTPSGKGKAKTAALKVVNTGTPSLSAGVSRNTVLLKGSNDALAQVTVSPSKGSSELDVDSISFIVDKEVRNATDGTDNAVDNALIIELGNSNITDNCTADPFKKVTCSLNETIDQSVALRIAINDEDLQEGTINLNTLRVNNSLVNGTFSKTYSNAVVYFTKQESINDNTQTRWTLEVDTYDNETVSNLRLYSGENITSRSNTGFLYEKESISDGDTWTVNNLEAATSVKTICYEIDTTGHCYSNSSYMNIKGTDDAITVFKNK